MKKYFVLALAVAALPVFSGEWQTDLVEARKTAKAQGKFLLINFSGSDWCGWCKKFDREVFTQDAFFTWAEDKFVLVQVDFPKYKPQSREERLLRMSWRNEYKVRSFPTVLLVDGKSGAELHRMGYLPGGTDAFIERLTPYLKKSPPKQDPT